MKGEKEKETEKEKEKEKSSNKLTDQLDMKIKNKVSTRMRFLPFFPVLFMAIPMTTRIHDGDTTARPVEVVHNKPIALVNDNRVSLQFGEERMVINDGLQPSMLCTKSGALVVQSQNSKKPFPQQR